MKKILTLLAIGFVFTGCSMVKSPGNKDLVQLTGKIQQLGMSTFQYGTHIIKSADKTYALKSSTVNLDTYIDKEVIVKGTKVKGYPVENGPDLIEVTELKLK
ncbi:hypothetical protein [Pedobacter cryoconitis]|uniref:Lipoprotein n=1 Tax=Pedobacter cryoconitis TaxID=188932 RepID=A0A7X0J7H5_9SPHI|nr:hypothetical protein [Pedobacter cryoconitis]MBB6502510.1 hypothetical protein [Pedobacter cryoconitis]